MAEELICTASVCTLHDYPVNPVFCEYVWSKEQARKERDTQFNQQSEMIERVIEKVSQRVIGTLYELLESNETHLPDNSSNRDAERLPNTNKKKREGGISI